MVPVLQALWRTHMPIEVINHVLGLLMTCQLAVLSDIH